MKKWMVVLMLSMVCSMSACSNGNTNNEPETLNNEDSLDKISGKSDMDSNTAINDDVDEGDTEVDEKNRTILVEALGEEADSSNISDILVFLNIINAGQIQSAEYAEVDGEEVINVVAEEGTNYRIYLFASGSVFAIENLDTGEWPIQSTM